MIGFAPAKINLGLFVTGKRADGFHDLQSAFWPVGWNDVIVFPIRRRMDWLPYRPHHRRRPVQRVVDLPQGLYGIGGVTAHLHKAIP